MRAKSERLLLAGSLLAALALAGAIGFKTVTEGNREAAVAKLTKAMPVTRLDRVPTKSAPEPRPSVGQVSDPPNPSDSSGSVARFARLFDRMKGIPDPKKWQADFGNLPQDWTDSEWKLVEAELAGMQDLLRDARDAAELGGRALDLDLSKGMATELPHVPNLRTLARLLALDAWIQARGEHYQDAVQDILAIMKLADCLVDEPIVVSQMLRIAMDIIAYDTLRLAMPPAALSPELTEELSAYASRSDHRQAFADAFFGEAKIVMVEFARIRKGTSVDEVLDGGWFGRDRRDYSPMEEALEDALLPLFQGKKAIARKLYDTPVGKPWRDMDEATCLSLLTTMADAARLPYHQARPLIEQVRQNIESLPSTRLLSIQFVSGLQKRIAAQARLEAVLDLMQLGLAIDQYGTRNSSYPPSLNALASTLGGNIPTDPFTGQPYRYRVSDGGYSLYSVGHNLIDDGGKDNPKKGDLVWRTQQAVAP